MIDDFSELGSILRKIMQRLITNKELIKLLYYTDKDPLAQESLSQEQIQKDIFDKLIKITPRISPEESKGSNAIISIKILNGIPTENKKYKEILFTIETYVPLTQWFIKNENLRPFLIMGQISRSLNNKNINGIGRIIEQDFELLFLTEEVSCYEQKFIITTND